MFSFHEGVARGVEPLPSGSQPDVQQPLHHGHHAFVVSTPTRTRTRNTSVETRHDVHFTIGAKRKAWDLNPLPREGARFSKPARPAVSDYLP